MRIGIIVTVVVLAAVLAAGLTLSRFGTKSTPVVTTKPATKPAPQAAATQPATAPTTQVSYIDVVRRANPLVPATQPLAVPVELEDAAHLVFRDPVYLDPLGNLWVTRPDASPTGDVLKTVLESTEYVVRDRPVFVHWYLGSAAVMQAGLVVPGPRGGFDLVTTKRRQHLADGRPYRWASAYSLASRIVVPTDVGVSVFDVEPKVAEQYHPLPGCVAGKTTPPVTLPDTRGIVAWAPWDGDRPGGSRVSRFLDDGWHDLPAADWPTRPIHLSMLRDGSVLRIALPEPPSTRPAVGGPIDVEGDAPTTGPAAPPPPLPPDTVALSIAPLDPAQYDAAHVNDLIAQLGDPDVDRRQAAFGELAQYGPSVAPLLAKGAETAIPTAAMRLHQLLRTKLTPALGGMAVTDSRLAVALRQDDGTVLFFARAGVAVPTEGDDAQVVVPAWVVAHSDGRVDRPLPAALAKDQTEDRCTLRSAGDEWLAMTDVGPQRFLGNGFTPLLAPSEHRFTQWLGLAAHRRWVFRDPATGDTLVVDPTVADPTPRLPAWTLTVAADQPINGGPAGADGVAGWDDHDNPVLRHADAKFGFALGPDGWIALTPADHVHAKLKQPAPATTNPADAVLLVLPDGTRYADGRETLVITDPAGRATRWPLPAAAVGSLPTPRLARTPDGLLFLYNQPGRLLRLRPTPPGSPQPYALEATFTTDVPDSPNVARLWCDPAGRLCLVCDDTTLCVMFPTGRVPRSIAEMMPMRRP